MIPGREDPLEKGRLPAPVSWPLQRMFVPNRNSLLFSVLHSPWGRSQTAEQLSLSISQGNMCLESPTSSHRPSNFDRNHPHSELSLFSSGLWFRTTLPTSTFFSRKSRASPLLDPPLAFVLHLCPTLQVSAILQQTLLLLRTFIFKASMHL